MRGLLIMLVVIAPAIAAAKPTVAVTPFDGDSGGKVAAAVAKGADYLAKTVTSPKQTAKAMVKLDLTGDLDKGDQKRLRAKLRVDVVIQGKVERDGRQHSVELKIAGKGVKTSRVKLRFKSVTSADFRADLRAALAKRLVPDTSEDDDDDPRAEEDERTKAKARKDRDRDRSKRVARDDDDDDEADDEVVVRKKRKKRRRSNDDDDDDGDEAPPGRHAVTQVAIRVNAGAGFARRGLTYDASGNQAPPRVGTAGPSGRLEVEAYPASRSTLKGIVAGLGVYGDYDMTFLVGIDVPGTNARSKISQSHFSIGARYRRAFGSSTVAFGVGYAARKYVADRGGLGNAMLDMPDVTYAAIAPNAVARIGVTPKIGAFFGAAFLLLLDAGPIATNANFGYGTSFAFEAAGGADILLAKNYGMRIAAELSQVGLSFDAGVRGVSGATDRTIGLAATFEVLY